LNAIAQRFFRSAIARECGQAGSLSASLRCLAAKFCAAAAGRRLFRTRFLLSFGWTSDGAGCSLSYAEGNQQEEDGGGSNQSVD
jgi:hypothetical protein